MNPGYNEPCPGYNEPCPGYNEQKWPVLSLTVLKLERSNLSYFIRNFASISITVRRKKYK